MVVNIAFPLTPFVLGGLVRCAVSSLSVTWETFSASELAVSLGLLALFVNQSLLNSRGAIDDDFDRREELSGSAVVFLMLAMCSFMLFGLIEGFAVAVNGLGVDELVLPLAIFRTAAFFFLPLVMYLAVRAQESFRLRTNI